MIPKRNIPLLIGLLLMIWPFVHDQVALSCDISSKACSNGETTALIIILFSIIIGSLLASYGFLADLEPTNRRALYIIFLWTGLTTGSLILYFIVALSRNMT